MTQRSEIWADRIEFIGHGADNLAAPLAERTPKGAGVEFAVEVFGRYAQRRVAPTRSADHVLIPADTATSARNVPAGGPIES